MLSAEKNTRQLGLENGNYAFDVTHVIDLILDKVDPELKILLRNLLCILYY